MVCGTEGRIKTRHIAILTHNFFFFTIACSVIFTTPLSTYSASRPGLLSWRPQRGILSDCKLALIRSFLTPTQITHQHILFHNAYNFQLDHVIFFRLFTKVCLWLTVWSMVNMQHHRSFSQFVLLLCYCVTLFSVICSFIVVRSLFFCARMKYKSGTSLPEHIFIILLDDFHYSWPTNNEWWKLDLSVRTF